ncbi:MAG: hypothetical protein ACT4OX_15840 [Actinomycetota bacterium]
MHGVRWGGVVLAVAVGCAACGGDGSETAPPSSTAAPVDDATTTSAVETRSGSTFTWMNDRNAATLTVDGTQGQLDLDGEDVADDVALWLVGSDGLRADAAVTRSLASAAGRARPAAPASWSVDFPSDPIDAGFVGFDIDDVPVGGFMTASAFAALAVPGSLDPTSLRPTSGRWDLAMTIGTQYMSGGGCPTGASPQSMTTTGPADVYVGDQGMSAVVHVQDVVLDLRRTTVNEARYAMLAPRPFPVGDSGSGEASLELLASDREHLAGTLTADNGEGCILSYPVALALFAPFEVQPYIPVQATWTWELTATACGAPVALSGGGLATVTGGVGGIPITTTIPGLGALFGSADTNLHTGGPFFLGVTMAPSPADMTLPVAASVYAQLDLIAMSETMIVGTAFGFTAHGCTVVGTFTLHSG